MVVWAAVGLLLPAAGTAQTPTTAARGISFPTTQSVEAQRYFAQGLAALHLFEYEDANEAFRLAERADPTLALAYWGEAMTFSQILWRNEDVGAGRAALRRVARPRAEKGATPTERELIDAAATLFGDGDATSRHQKYADAMARLYERNADDPDLAALYALALLGTVSRSLIGYEDAREGHVHGLAGSPVQARVAAILDGVQKTHPDHAGALHYLLHTYDDPEHASLGLAAARSLAALAPDSSHARHMPAHIFLQLGLWRDAAASDRSAFDASTAWVARKQLPPAMRNYHALSWLEYELLQRGKYRDASQTLARLEPVVKSSTDNVRLLSDLSSMRARFVIETERWPLMANERNFANVNDLFAIGMSAARSHNQELAVKARDGLVARAQSELEGDLRPAIAIMEREISALIQLDLGRAGDAIQILRAAAKAELELPPPLGLPEPAKPAPELLGEVLVEVGRPREAIEPFEQALRRHANRSLSVLGLARARRAVGDIEGSRRHYRELLANFDEADGDLPVLAEAKKALEKPPSTFRYAIGFVLLLTVVSAVVLVLARRRRTPLPAATPAQSKRARSAKRRRRT
jgi:tetratricopeptide (TPR) repeat protein